MAEKYGPVMGVKMLHSHVVVLSDMEAIHQAFVKQGPIFAGRQKGGIFDVFSRGRGIATRSKKITSFSIFKFIHVYLLITMYKKLWKSSTLVKSIVNDN